MSERDSLSPFFDANGRFELSKYHYFLWADDPATAAEELTDRIKLASKLLKKVWDAPRTKCLEAIAIGAGYLNWYGMNHALKSFIDVTDSNTKEERFKKLGDMATLFVSEDAEVPLDAKRLQLLTTFSERISNFTSISLEAIRNSVCAGLCDANSWREVESRNLLDASKPLYSFQVSENGKSGVFEPSSACHALSEELESFQSQSPYQTWIVEALLRQPCFMKGALVRAIDLQSEGQDYEAFEIVDQTIELLEKIIPKGFRGLMDHEFGDNQLYQALLYHRSIFLWEFGDLKKSLRDARRILRIDPWDSMGISIHYPLMLLTQGNYQAANQAIRHIKSEYHLALPTIAFCKYAVGDQAGFEHYLALALIDIPAMRWILLNEDEKLPKGDDGSRHYDRDDDGVDDYFDCAQFNILCVPGLERACLEFLSAPSTKDLELRFHKLWAKHKRTGGPWHEAREEFADRHPKRRGIRF